jgi:hypothetical protein
VGRIDGGAVGEQGHVGERGSLCGARSRSMAWRIFFKLIPASATA